MDNEVVGALPTGGQASSPLLRNFLIKRMIYSFETTDDPSTFNALDGDTGSLPQVLAFNGSFFWLDTDDTTSDHDGVAVIATADGYRYKVDDVDYRIRSALSDTETDPPESPSLGDAYLIPAAASGAWSSHQDDIAIWTRNGWRFEIPGIGKWLLIEDVGGFKGYYSDGWSYGPGARSFDDESIPLSASLGWGERVIVESQTTTVPPTATKGLRYIVGEDAEDDWLGKDGQIAVCEVDGEWTFYQPSNGWAAYDKSQGNEYRYDGSDWVSAAGAVLGYKDVYTAGNGSVTRDTGTGYNYATANFPTSAQDHWDDGINIAGYAARAVGNILVFEYSCLLTAGGSSQAITGGIIRGNEATALAFDRVDFATQTTLARFRFRIVASDTLAKDYRMGFWPNATPASALSSVEHRHFSVTEYLP